MSEISIRPAKHEDSGLLFGLICEMSEYERLPMLLTEHQLSLDGFGEAPLFRAFLAFADAEPAGYALTHACYTDFEGRGLFLESLYVKEPFRGQGVADQLLSEVARVARDQECYGIILNILRWNSPALAFFKKAGAVELNDRTIYV